MISPSPSIAVLETALEASERLDLSQRNWIGIPPLDQAAMEKNMNKVPTPKLDPKKLQTEEAWKPDQRDMENRGDHEIPKHNQKEQTAPVMPPD